MVLRKYVARALAPDVFEERDELQGRVDKLEKQTQPLGEEYSIESEKRDNEFIDESIRDSLGVLLRDDPYYQDEGEMYRIWQDETYWCPVKKDFQAFLGATEVSEYDYVDERYDCESFSESFRTRFIEQLGVTSVGLITQFEDPNAHVWNVVVYANGDVEMIEPEDAVFVTERTDEMYRLDGDGVIWL